MMSMFADSTAFSMTAALFYLVVAFAAAAAGRGSALRLRNPRDAAKWFMIAAFFVLCFVFRAFEIEEALRQSFRAGLRADGLYEGRRATQRVLAATTVVAGSTVAFGLVYYFSRHRSGRRDFALGAAILGALGLLGLMILRLISLHHIDSLLFGPLKLNWFADIGTSLIVLGAAVYYLWLMTAKPRSSA